MFSVGIIIAALVIAGIGVGLYGRSRYRSGYAKGFADALLREKSARTALLLRLRDVVSGAPVIPAKKTGTVKEGD